jgi:hypothetical protein
LGTSAGSDRLSRTNRFFANAGLKILFPEEAQKVECILRSAGLKKLADNVTELPKLLYWNDVITT